MRENYEMFSATGNKACMSLVKKVCKKIEGKTRLTQEDVCTMLREGMNKIATKHGEVYDTEPAWHIANEVTKTLSHVGYGFSISRYDL